MSTRTALVLVAALTPFAGGCAIPRTSHQLIDRYAAAECVPPSAPSSAQPNVREWDVLLGAASGQAVRIVAHQRVSGRVVARDDRTGEERIVADAGDYIYPTDLRTNSQRDRVFVKASGLAGGLWHETWLFEYDLVQNHQADKVRVKPSVLPLECPAGAADR